MLRWPSRAEGSAGLRGCPSPTRSTLSGPKRRGQQPSVAGAAAVMHVPQTPGTSSKSASSTPERPAAAAASRRPDSRLRARRQIQTVASRAFTLGGPPRPDRHQTASPAVRAAARPSLASLFAVVRRSLTHRCFPAGRAHRPIGGQSFFSRPVSAATAAVASTQPASVRNTPSWAGPSAIHASRWPRSTIGRTRSTL